MTIRYYNHSFLLAIIALFAIFSVRNDLKGIGVRVGDEIGVVNAFKVTSNKNYNNHHRHRSLDTKNNHEDDNTNNNNINHHNQHHKPQNYVSVAILRGGGLEREEEENGDPQEVDPQDPTNNNHKNSTTTTTAATPSSESILESYVEQVSQRDATSHTLYQQQKEQKELEQKQQEEDQNYSDEDDHDLAVDINDNDEEDEEDDDDDDDDDVYNNNNDTNENDDDNNGHVIYKKRKKEGALNDPDSSDDDDDDDHDDYDDVEDHHEDHHEHDDDYDHDHNDDHEFETTTEDELKVDILNMAHATEEEVHDENENAIMEEEEEESYLDTNASATTSSTNNIDINKIVILEKDHPSTTSTKQQNSKKSKNNNNTTNNNPFDQALIDAFLPLLYPPPVHNPKKLFEHLESNAIHIDVSSRRRLDRRTLYQSLLLEWNAHHHSSSSSATATKNKDSNNNNNNNSNKKTTISKRNFINQEISHQLKSCISLASQPLWRKHISKYSTNPTIGGTSYDESLSSESLESTESSESTTSSSSSSSKNKSKNEKKSKNASSRSKDGSEKDEKDDVQSTTTLPPSSNKSFYSTGIRLYTTFEEDDEEDEEDEYQSQRSSSSSNNAFFPNNWNGNEDDEESSSSSSKSSSKKTSSSSILQSKSLKSTLGMQETVAIALAHSYNCGFVLLDDVSLESVQESLVQNKDLDLDYDSNEIKFGSLIHNLIRLANEGKLPRVLGDYNGYSNNSDNYDYDENGGEQKKSSRRKKKNVWNGGRISTRMERDIALGLDDPNDELAIESMKLMKSDEEEWMALEDDDDDNDDENHNDHHHNTQDDTNPLPLVLFLRTDASPKMLKSKSTVDRLARECVSEDSIHLLMMGRGIDATTVNLPSNMIQSGGINQMIGKQGSMKRSSMKPPPSIMGGMPPPPGSGSNVNNPFFPPQQQQQHNPFEGMSSMPPPGMHGSFSASMNGNGGGGPGGSPFGFTQQNINASGVNDPEGSRRFNIFLARTMDKDGTPGIMGAIAPPQVGNLFPQMLAMQARENYIRSQEDGDSEEEIKKHEANMNRWAEVMEQQQRNHSDQNDNDEEEDEESLPPQFFNASISGGPPGGMGFPFMPMDGNNQFNGMISPPPELIQQAIEQAVSDVMQQLTEMSKNDGKDGSNKFEDVLPPKLAKAFTQILSNDNLRRGIAENLARAAPALVDPRCQGVMLSVYVPPPPDHPNRGMMPGQQRSPHQQQAPKQRQSVKKSTKRGKSGLGAPGMGGWLNKILSTTSYSSSQANDGNESQTEDNGLDEDISDNEGVTESSGESQSKKEQSNEKFISDAMSQAAEKKLRKRDRQARAAAVAAATAMINQHKEEKKKRKTSASGGSNALSTEQKIDKHLTRLQALCKATPIKTPSDPVRSRSWDAWAIREHGAIIFRKNRRALNNELIQRDLRINVNVGSKGMGSMLRQMLSVKDISHEMEDLITCAVEFEAARSQRSQDQGKSSVVSIDVSLTQLLPQGVEASVLDARSGKDVHFIHPKSIEKAISSVSRISPSPTGTSILGTSQAVTHRTKEEIAELAEDKHERALVSQVVSPQDIGVSYDMIGGLGDVKELLRQSITYPLKFPHLYSEGIAREAVKGVLLFGPPGTGKTMLAKAVATEGGATFLSVDASSVENKWLGESEKNAKAVFTLARRLAPCVIFIDEVDSILSSREGTADDSAHGTLTSVKTTMMSEWDGLNSGTNGNGEAGSDRVVVIGSTNRPFDLDEAVLRRFPRRILVDLPDLDTRREILEVTLAENRLDPAVNLTAIAERLDGYTGSDIKEVCREAVVQISHEQARRLDSFPDDSELSDFISEDESSISSLNRLRPATMKDFESAMKKLKRSVSEKGRELMRVWEWNDEYGEIKKKKRNDMPQLMNMFV